jgi:hypothetical protein
VELDLTSSSLGSNLFYGLVPHCTFAFSELSNFA